MYTEFNRLLQCRDVGPDQGGSEIFFMSNERRMKEFDRCLGVSMSESSEGSIADLSINSGNSQISLDVPPVMPPTPDNEVRLRKQRRKLLALHLASTCQHRDIKASCPIHVHCLAHKRLYKHVVHCRHKYRVCQVPGCAKMKSVWNHYRRCSKWDCSICSVIPDDTPFSPRIQALRMQAPAM